MYLGQAQTYWLTNGYLDQVRLFSRSLSAAEVSQLYADVPAALFKFDEGARAATFVNASGTANGTCSGDACPTSDLKGKVGSAVNFDGVNDAVQVSNSLQRSIPMGRMPSVPGSMRANGRAATTSPSRAMPMTCSLKTGN